MYGRASSVSSDRLTPPMFPASLSGPFDRVTCLLHLHAARILLPAPFLFLLCDRANSTDGETAYPPKTRRTLPPGHFLPLRPWPLASGPSSPLVLPSLVFSSHPACHPLPTSAATIILFGIMAPYKGQFHAVNVRGQVPNISDDTMEGYHGPSQAKNIPSSLGNGAGLSILLPRREVWGVPGRNISTNMGGGILLFAPWVTAISDIPKGCVLVGH